MKQIIQTDRKTAGPYSHAVMAEGRFVFFSGQVGTNPETGQLAEGVEAQTRQVLENIKGLLALAGLDFRHVVKTTVFLHNIADFATLNGVYAEYFNEAPPARSTFGGLDLPLGALVEIECIAVLEN